MNRQKIRKSISCVICLGRQHTTLPNVPKKLHEIKTIRTPRGRPKCYYVEIRHWNVRRPFNATSSKTLNTDTNKRNLCTLTWYLFSPRFVVQFRCCATYILPFESIDVCTSSIRSFFSYDQTTFQIKLDSDLTEQRIK